MVRDFLEMPRLGQDLDRTGRLHPEAIERGVTHAHDGVFSQKITMTMHNSTHMNAPIHLVQGGADIAIRQLPVHLVVS